MLKVTPLAPKLKRWGTCVVHTESERAVEVGMVTSVPSRGFLQQDCPDAQG